ncbi:ABC transporter permease [Venenivibrio stagnispumantis]|nr:ABC transporter permease [Venenivibrio stagnispumantis]MCW4573220.1 ABC transporter permease [Venenivibrio stagnispumantis]
MPLKEMEYYKDLILELTKKDIKVRYKNSYLGYLWSLANPLFLTLIFYFIFKIVTKVQIPNYTLFLISGLFIWQWISNSIMAGTNLYISNASLIKKVNFPRNFLVISLVLSEGFNFIISIPVIIFFVYFYGKSISLNWSIIPVYLTISALFIYSLSLLIATINLFFRDMERITGLFLTFVFYLTPIIYPMSMVPNEYKLYLYVNIFFPIVNIWQELFFNNHISYMSILLSVIYSILLVFISHKIYNKLKYKFAELV